MNTKENVIAAFRTHIAPKYPNGMGEHKPVLCKFVYSPQKSWYGIRFEKNPVVGQKRQGDRIIFIIEEIL